MSSNKIRSTAYSHAERARGGAAGFTLLELLLAVTLFAILASIVYGVLVKTLEAKEVAEQRAEMFALGRETVLRMADELEGALQPGSGDRYHFLASAPDSVIENALVEFIRMNRGGYGMGRVRAGAAMIAYSLGPKDPVTGFSPLIRDEVNWATATAPPDDEQQNDSEFDLQEDDPADNAPPQMRANLLDCLPESLEMDLPGSCARISGVRFRFYDDAIEDFRDTWNSWEADGPTENRLPAAVEITLGLLDERGFEHLFTTIVDVPLARANPDPENLDADNENDDSGTDTNGDEAAE